MEKESPDAVEFPHLDPEIAKPRPAPLPRQGAKEKVVSINWATSRLKDKELV